MLYHNIYETYFRHLVRTGWVQQRLPLSTQLRIQDLAGGGAALIRLKKCVIWASEYNLGPQKWGGGGVRGCPDPGPPLDPLLVPQLLRNSLLSDQC